MHRIKKYLTISFIAFVVMAAIAVAARAQSTTVPFTAKVQGEVTVPQTVAAPAQSTVYYRPSGMSRLQSSMDDLASHMTDLENGQYRLSESVRQQGDAHAAAVAGLERKLGDSGFNWLWAIALVALGVIIGLLLRGSGSSGSSTTNNYYGRHDASDRGPEGLSFTLGRDLEEGDEIVFRKLYPQPVATEQIRTEKIDVTPEAAKLAKELLQMVFDAEAKKGKSSDPAPGEGGTTTKQ